MNPIYMPEYGNKKSKPSKSLMCWKRFYQNFSTYSEYFDAETVLFFYNFNLAVQKKLYTPKQVLKAAKNHLADLYTKEGY